jgi:hypothetical protein
MIRVSACSLLFCSAALAQPVWEDAELLGPNRQPRWTEQRSFTGPRVYVAPPGAVTAELWFDSTVGFDGTAARLRSVYAASIGLPFRFQLDVSLRLEHTALEPVKFDSGRVELRWAPARWEVLPWNPTLSLEWTGFADAPHRLAVRLLLGGNISARWYWAGHLFFERELWGTAQTHEYGLTGSVAYSLKPRTLSLGGGYRTEVVDLRNERFRARSVEFLVGPTMALQPVEGLQVLIGVFGGPRLVREDVTATFRATFVLEPTVVGLWRF